MSKSNNKSQSDDWLSKFPNTQMAINEMNHINSLLKEYQKNYPFTENFIIVKDEHDKDVEVISVTIDTALMI
ncbi:hypothetical protein ACFQ1R_11420 [Mariniflexile jejuense]|uniref:Uncharacterized protein n=1 Tax=Mariniflexile jejuense TaxID=1173582 RepID=A0ABW3JMC7_9FLAO